MDTLDMIMEATVMDIHTTTLTHILIRTHTRIRIPTKDIRMIAMTTIMITLTPRFSQARLHPNTPMLATLTTMRTCTASSCTFSPILWAVLLS